MNLFITGATGGLGHTLVKMLHSKGHSTTVLTRKATTTHSVPCRTIVGDLLALPTYAHGLAGHQAVIHLAAVTHSTDPAQYHAVNTHGTELLLQAAAAAGVQRFLYVSTRAIGQGCGAYGESKALAEEAVRTSGLDWTILRPGEVYGASPNEAVDKTISATQRGLFIPYVAHPSALLAPVHRDDVLLAIIRALEASASIGMTYTLAGPQEFSQAEMIARLRDIFPGLRVPVPVPVLALNLAAALFRLLKLRRPPFVPDQIPRLLCPKVAVDNLANKDLGFTPRTIEEGVSSLFR